jgi:hypothetical protein
MEHPLLLASTPRPLHVLRVFRDRRRGFGTAF